MHIPGRWEKEKEELRKEKEASSVGSGAAKPAGFGKPKAAVVKPKLLEILVYPDPRLRAENKPVTAFDAALQQLAKDMFHTMYKCGHGRPLCKHTRTPTNTENRTPGRRA